MHCLLQHGAFPPRAMYPTIRIMRIPIIYIIAELPSKIHRPFFQRTSIINRFFATGNRGGMSINHRKTITFR